MIPFTESLRYEYPLTDDSMVADAGGYEGNFAKLIHERYHCHVVCFEPVFHARVTAALQPFSPKVRVVPYGLGGSTRTETMRIKGDSTGIFADSGTETDVQIVDIADILGANRARLDLLKLNIEGMEFEVLERLLSEDLAVYCRNIQVQFHPVAPDYDARYKAIAGGLARTHRLTYFEPWCWENWERS